MSEKNYIYGVLGQSELFRREGQIDGYELIKALLLGKTL